MNRYVILLALLLVGCQGEFDPAQERELVKACTDNGGRPKVSPTMDGKSSTTIRCAAVRK